MPEASTRCHYWGVGWGLRTKSRPGTAAVLSSRLPNARWDPSWNLAGSHLLYGFELSLVCSFISERVKLLLSQLVPLCVACFCHYPEAKKRCLVLEVCFLSTCLGDENKQVCVVAAPRASTWFQCRELQHHFLHVAAVGVEIQSLRLLSEALTCGKKCLSSWVVNCYLVWVTFFGHLICFTHCGGCVCCPSLWMETVLQWAQCSPHGSAGGHTVFAGSQHRIEAVWQQRACS